MEFRVLGPLEVVVGGRRIGLDSARRRTILAVLLAARGQVVSTGRLGDAVWGTDLPASFHTTLRSHVSRLRRALAADSPSGRAVIVTESDGYRLDVDAGDVDADRFEAVVAEARALSDTDTARAVALLEEAEDLWRGPAFGELAGHEVVRVEAVHLEELRGSAAAERVDAQLALGFHEEVIGELEARLDAEPLAEGPYAQLMLALYRSGRQADALATFRRLREQLREELGVDPSPPVQALHARLLRQDPDLAAPRRPAGSERSEAGGRYASGSVPPASDADRPTPLFGRDEDVQWVAALVTEAPLVTLTGPGGVGKTRLAERVGAVVEEHYEGGVVTVRLASIRDPDSVGAAVLGALDVPQQAGRSAEETIVSAVGTGQLLLVLDCCEHVLASVSQLVTAVLRRCPSTTVLATSREPLRLSGERVWRVPPLLVPGTGAGADDVAGSPAGALFCTRAAAAEPGFSITEEDAATVAELCWRLDGVPLAIELAAARVRAMDPADLLARLSDRFALLTGGPPHEGGRHRTLEAVVDWSYGLLEEKEARLFERLSVFAGAFSLEAAERVVADDEVAAAEVAGVAAELVDKSMVSVDRTDGTVCYRLLDTLREFGAARLAEAGATDSVRRAHAAYHVALAERLGPRMRGPDEKAASAAIDAAMDDLRLAHEWLVAAGDVDGALRLPGALNDYLVHRLRGEVAKWAERALALPGATEHPLHPLGLATAVWGDMHRDDTTRARARSEAVLARDANDLASYYAIGALRAMAMRAGRLDEMFTLDTRGTGVADALGEDYVRASLGWQGTLARLFAGRRDEARAVLPEFEEAAEASGNPTVRAHLHYCHGELLADTDPEEAARRLESAVDLARDVDSHLTSGAALVALAALRDRQGESERSLALFREAIGHWQRFGTDRNQLTALRNLVVALASVGADEAAARLHGAVTPPASDPSFGVEADKLASSWTTITQRMGTDAAEVQTVRGRRLSVAEAADEAAAVLDDLLHG